MAEAVVPLQTRDEDVVTEAVVPPSTRTRWRRPPSCSGRRWLRPWFRRGRGTGMWRRRPWSCRGRGCGGGSRCLPAGKDAVTEADGRGGRPAADEDGGGRGPAADED